MTYLTKPVGDSSCHHGGVAYLADAHNRVNVEGDFSLLLHLGYELAPEEPLDSEEEAKSVSLQNRLLTQKPVDSVGLQKEPNDTPQEPLDSEVEAKSVSLKNRLLTQRGRNGNR